MYMLVEMKSSYEFDRQLLTMEELIEILNYVYRRQNLDHNFIKAS
jgi:hypothetical protein